MPYVSATTQKKQEPINQLTLGPYGSMRPSYNPKALKSADVRTITNEFLLSLQELWRAEGDDILMEVRHKYPELIFQGMIKLAKVSRIEVGAPGDFSRLGKDDILAKLEERGGPRARELFEKFMAELNQLNQGDSDGRTGDSGGSQEPIRGTEEAK